MTSPPIRRLRIGFLTGTLNTMGGTERMAVTLANALAEHGFESSVLSLWGRSSCFPLHPAVTHDAIFSERPSYKRAYVRTVMGIRQYAKRHDIDVLVLVDTMLTLFTVPALAGLGVRQIAWEHFHFDENLGRRARPLARRLAARACNEIVVLTERDRARWIEALQPKNRVVSIRNPLSFPMPEQLAPRDTKTVLAVGRLTHQKAFDVLLKAWAEVSKYAPDWKLLIAGEGEDRADLEALRQQLGLESSVTLPGTYADVTTVYRQASIFCLSSRYEGLPLVLIEAMAYGLPIVSTDCKTGPHELFGGTDAAVLVPVDDPTALAAQLLSVINNPEEATRLGAAARSKAREYALDHVVQQWLALLEPAQE